MVDISIAENLVQMFFEEIRNNTLGNFGAQLRTVTPEDYLVRVLSLPPQFGTIAKAYIEATQVQNINLGEIPSILDLYILTYVSKYRIDPLFICFNFC